MSGLISRLRERRGQPSKTPDWHSCLDGVLGTICASEDKVVFADAAFPRHVLHHALHDVPMLRVVAPGVADAFHARFRYGGGAKPIGACAVDTLAPLAADARLWLYVDSLTAVSDLLPDLAQLEIRLLCIIGVGDFEAIRLAVPALANWSAVRFVMPKGQETEFVGLAPTMVSSQGSLFSRKGPRPRGSVEALIRGPVRTISKTTIQATGAHSASGAFQARVLVTDNGHVFEQRNTASRLWLGPAQMNRFAIGRIPGNSARLFVDFLSSDSHTKLDETVALQLDGKRVAHELGKAPDGSDRALIDLGDRTASILTIACRNSHRVQGDLRVIRAYISRMGFIS